MKATSEQLQTMQKTEFEIFKVFVAICEKLKIKYYLYAGTLLGAVRHQGFIPWDDDIDVCMFREDYEKFLAEAPALLPSHLFLQTYITDPEYPQVFAKIRNSNTAFIEIPVKDRKMNHGLFIDIFPLDGYPQSKVRQNSIKVKTMLLNSRISYALNTPLSWKVKLVRRFMRLVYPKLSDALRAKDRLYRSITECDYVTNYSTLDCGCEAMPRHWYGDGVQLTFEGLSVRAPVEYDKWLIQVYGDYMQFPPIEKRVTEHQTVYIDTNKSYLEYTEEG